jgi:hypothetical protein
VIEASFAALANPARVSDLCTDLRINNVFVIASVYSGMSTPDDLMKAKIVHLIQNRRTEVALKKLSDFYNIDTPQIVVGTIKGKRRTVYAVYVCNQRKIYTLDSELFYNPFVVLHEYYHHIRSRGGTHRGSEKLANLYAQEFISAYKRVLQNDLGFTELRGIH